MQVLILCVLHLCMMYCSLKTVDGSSAGWLKQGMMGRGVLMGNWELRLGRQGVHSTMTTSLIPFKLCEAEFEPPHPQGNSAAVKWWNSWLFTQGDLPHTPVAPPPCPVLWMPGKTSMPGDPMCLWASDRQGCDGHCVAVATLCVMSGRQTRTFRAEDASVRLHAHSVWATPEL